jgi:hypothetical protein
MGRLLGEAGHPFSGGKLSLYLLYQQSFEVMCRVGCPDGESGKRSWLQAARLTVTPP